MSTFSDKEKIEILQFIENNRLSKISLNIQEKWEELGKKLNRDWKTIYNFYKEWKIDNEEIMMKTESDDQVAEANTTEEVGSEENCLAELSETNNENINENENEGEIIQYVSLDGQMINLDDFDQFILCDTNTLAAINNEVEEAVTKKRKLNLNDFDTALLNTLEKQSREELEMQREEHDKKMKILNSQLEYGEEIHNEKMKILKAKLKAVQQQIHHIDHVICNRHLQRKFKSGPI